MAEPRDGRWREAVLVWNGLVAGVPPLVVEPASTEEVAAAVRFANDHGLGVRVARGDRGSPTPAAERAVTVDLCRMREFAVDPAAGLVHVGPGCRAEAADRLRRLGWTLGELEAAEIVTPEGAVVIAGANEYAHLFSALRCDADVGVVTRSTFRLHASGGRAVSRSRRGAGGGAPASEGSAWCRARPGARS